VEKIEKQGQKMKELEVTVRMATASLSTSAAINTHASGGGSDDLES